MDFQKLEGLRSVFIGLTLEGVLNECIGIRCLTEVSVSRHLIMHLVIEFSSNLKTQSLWDFSLVLLTNFL